jgi:alkylation response protein AidB-like acyl-CoA dehydrogenase
VAADGVRRLADDALAAERVAAESRLPADGGDLDKPAVLSEQEVAELVEFFLWGLFSAAPEKYGGGELTDKEQRMLGKVWGRALLPVLEKYGADAGWVFAVVVTGEVLVKRAVLARVALRVQSADEGDK